MPRSSAATAIGTKNLFTDDRLKLRVIDGLLPVSRRLASVRARQLLGAASVNVRDDTQPSSFRLFCYSGKLKGILVNDPKPHPAIFTNTDQAFDVLRQMDSMLQHYNLPSGLPLRHETAINVFQHLT